MSEVIVAPEVRDLDILAQALRSWAGAGGDLEHELGSATVTTSTAA